MLGRKTFLFMCPGPRNVSITLHMFCLKTGCFSFLQPHFLCQKIQGSKYEQEFSLPTALKSQEKEPGASPISGPLLFLMKSTKGQHQGLLGPD